MLLAALTVLATLHTGVPSDTGVDAAAVYALVLQDVRARSRAQHIDAPVVLEEAVYVDVGSGSTAERRWHSPRLISRLRRSRSIQGTCRIEGTRTTCANQRGALNVRLGEILKLPDSARIRIEDPPFGTAAAIRDSSRVPVTMAVDVVVGGPCRSACTTPDARSYRYFLRGPSQRRYVIVTRVLTGAT